MRTIGVFVDTTIVNRILDIKVKKLYEQDRLYLSRIVEQYVKGDIVRFIVNPTVEREIKNTRNPERKAQLRDIFNQFHFIPYNKTIFPLTFPATFLTEQEKETLEELFRDLPSRFKKDEKIFADAVFNSQIEVLLTTDKEHLANDRFRNRLGRLGLDKKIRIFTPKQFLEYLQNVA